MDEMPPACGLEAVSPIMAARGGTPSLMYRCSTSGSGVGVVMGMTWSDDTPTGAALMKVQAHGPGLWSRFCGVVKF